MADHYNYPWAKIVLAVLGQWTPESGVAGGIRSGPVKLPTPQVVVYEDNQSARQLAVSEAYKPRTRQDISIYSK